MIASKCSILINFGGGGSFSVLNGARGHKGIMDGYKWEVSAWYIEIYNTNIKEWEGALGPYATRARGPISKAMREIDMGTSNSCDKGIRGHIITTHKNLTHKH